MKEVVIGYDGQQLVVPTDTTRTYNRNYINIQMKTFTTSYHCNSICVYGRSTLIVSFEHVTKVVFMYVIMV